MPIQTPAFLWPDTSAFPPLPSSSVVAANNSGAGRDGRRTHQYTLVQRERVEREREGGGGREEGRQHSPPLLSQKQSLLLNSFPPPPTNTATLARICIWALHIFTWHQPQTEWWMDAKQEAVREEDSRRENSGGCLARDWGAAYVMGSEAEVETEE